MATLSIFNFIKIIWKRKMLVVLFVTTATIGSVLYSLTLPNIFQAEAVISPLSASGIGGSSATSGIISLLGVATGGMDSEGSNFIVYLKSRTLCAQVVHSLNLIPKLVGEKTGKLSEDQIMHNACQALGGIVTAENDRLYKSQVILKAKHSDPEFATQLVRQYLTELQNFINSHSLTKAKRFRLFLEEQIARNKEEILQLGIALSNFYSRNSVSAMHPKLNVPVALSTQEGLRNFKDYDEFKKHFDVLQKIDLETAGRVHFVQNVPHHIYLKYLGTELTILEANYAGLSQSYQMAKLEEAKQEPSFEVLDEAVVPQYKISPNRRRIVMGAFVFSFFLSLLVVFYKEYLFFEKLSTRRADEALPGLEGYRVGV